MKGKKEGGRQGEGGREGRITGERERGLEREVRGKGKREKEQGSKVQHIALVAQVASLPLPSPSSFIFCGAKDETQGFALHTSGAFRLSHPHPKVVIFCLHSHAP